MKRVTGFSRRPNLVRDTSPQPRRNRSDEGKALATSNKPRIHHFVTQSWIKRFGDSDGKIYAFDRDIGDIKPRSSKKIMQIFDLYTLDPDGIDDTSTEEVDLMKIDDNGANVMTALLNGDVSEASRVALADFFAAQLMRDPQRLFDYTQTAQRFLRHLFVEAFCTADYAEFRTYFGDLIEEDAYDHVRAMGEQQAAVAIAKILNELDARGGMIELPFTDLIKSADGRDKLKDALLALRWELITAQDHSFILGDAAILFDPGQLAAGARIPVSSSAALVLKDANGTSPSGIAQRAAYSFEVDAMNFESAARSRRWMAGAHTCLDKVRTQVTGKALPPR